MDDRLRSAIVGLVSRAESNRRYSEDPKPVSFRWTWTVSGLVMVAAAVIIAVGCSPQRRERLKHFFFEVPDPAKSEENTPPSQTMVRPLPSVAGAESFQSMHPPFARRRCADCHDAERGQALLQPWADRCASCHPDTFEPRPFVHGPFASMACNECHLPHASTLPALLRRPDPDLCVTCHEPSMIRNDAYHFDLAMACGTCHEPHAGPDHRLLKPIESWRDLAPDYTATSRPAANEMPG